jgi:cation/acetate symporter
MVGLAFAVAASGNFPALILSIFWRKFTTAGAVTAIVTGTLAAVLLIWFSPTVQVEILGNAGAWFPLKNPAVVSMPLAFGLSILVSLLFPEPAARKAYDEKERRMVMGETL